MLTWVNAIYFEIRNLNYRSVSMEDFAMAETVTKLPVKQEKLPERVSTAEVLRPFDTLRREVEQLFDDFGQNFLPFPARRSLFDFEPLWRRRAVWEAVPAVDIAESEKAYEIAAELPGMDEKNVEVKVANGNLTIKGEKQEEKEEKKKDYYLHERHFGSFERSFEIPEGVDADKIEAKFKKGVLTVTLPKKPEAQKPAKKVEVKAA
jgi:HSP20 family protein